MTHGPEHIYSVGDKDDTQDTGDWCEDDSPGTGIVCTRPMDAHTQHASGDGEVIVETWQSVLVHHTVRDVLWFEPGQGGPLCPPDGETYGSPVLASVVAGSDLMLSALMTMSTLEVVVVARNLDGRLLSVVARQRTYLGTWKQDLVDLLTACIPGAGHVYPHLLSKPPTF
jgi:hypothetical protein